MQDAVFITYPDAFVRDAEKPLKTLSRLDLECFGAVHVLPFFPSTSDKGFSITDYETVDSMYGTWDDLPDSLMIDCVFNHTSASHPWFLEHPGYYVRFRHPPETSLFRPRSSPLFTKIDGWWYWTTFSADQIDLDVSRPAVQKELERILRMYIGHGAKLLRLDAAPYLFKDADAISTQQTHAYIKSLIHTFPEVEFIAEINRPQQEIDTYREYVRTYNFALPALVYHAFLHEDVSALVSHLSDDFGNYFNVLATHDGIGLGAARSYIEVDSLIEDVRSKGFLASDYELNINYFDALDQDERKLLTGHSLLLCLEGIPGIYYHSFFGSSGVRVAGRDANRAVIAYDSLMESLGSDTVVSRINSGIRRLLELRGEHISGDQEVRVQDGLLIIERDSVACVHNFTSRDVPYPSVHDLYSNERVDSIKPFGFAWYLQSEDLHDDK